MGKRIKIGLIFDDGFVKSSIATAKLFETLKIPAVFAVVAKGETFRPESGDFGLWNELQKRGHIIQPHGYTHLNLSKVPFEQAVGEIEKCLEMFGEKLEGFEAKQALYAFAYNSGTAELCEWLKPRVRAIRIGGNPFLSEEDLKGQVWTSTAFGPEDPAEDFARHIREAREKKCAALFYCLHGLDGELWGAIAKDSLKRIMEEILEDEALGYWALT